MRIDFDTKIAGVYKSTSQKTRVLTEDWVNKEVFCPACGMNISNYKNNRPPAFMGNKKDIIKRLDFGCYKMH